MTGRRGIFEEVGEDARGPAATPGIIDRGRQGARRAVRLWLIALFVMVAAMVVVGGLTRLTDSGLSITEWRPISGVLPPLSEAAWQERFALYQRTSEYLLQNKGMTLEEFKPIYWWEWGHRLLGRLVGLVWAGGLAFFLATRRVPPGWTWRLTAVGLLGGLQGLVGWWMVSSGLAPRMLDVASYRLAIHLGLAFVILGLLAGHILHLARSEGELRHARRAGDGGLATLTALFLVILFVQILLGALVAGIDAGRGYTDWPLMAGRIVPEGAFDLRPAWRNVFENGGLVQFVHRIAAYVLLVSGALLWWRSRKSGIGSTRRAYDWVALVLLAQAALGVVTVMYSAPLGLAIVHQVGAMLTWSLVLRARHLARYPSAQSLRGAALDRV